MNLSFILSLAFIIFLLITLAYFTKRKTNTVFYLLSIETENIKLFFSQLKSTKMTELRFLDTEAAGKFFTATFQLPANAAGNIPKFVADSVRASTSNTDVATAEVGEVNEEAGTYSLKVALKGKAGSADCKLIGNPDLDGSGDPEIEALLTVVITTEEAKAFGEPVISELQG